MIKLALLTTDSREHFKDYANPNPYFGTAPEALIEGFKLVPANVEVHVISCLQTMPASSPRKLANNIYYHPLHVPNIGWLKTGYLGCIRAVRRELRKINPDIVHGQGTERDCAICAVYSGLPNILTLHGNMRTVAGFLQARPLTYYWLASRLERLCLRKTNGVVAISSYTNSNVSAYTHRTWLVPNAVHPSYFDLPRRQEFPHRILCVANISPIKNQIGLIKSLDAFAANKPFRLIFAGGGSEADEYYGNFRKMVGERPWCEYLGALDRRAVQNEITRATIGVLSSYEDNCPMVILEAAAAGLPFAASAVGGIPDLIKHEVTGLLFNPTSPTDINCSIARLISETSATLALAEAARASCKERSAPESVARKHLSIYSTVLGQKLGI